MELLGYVGAVVIGLSLGLLGGGGSILAVPLLVYLFKVPAGTATFYSLFIVGLTSAVGFVKAAQAKQVNLSALAVFAIPSMAGVLVVRRLILPTVPTVVDFSVGSISKDALILIAFAVVMLMASVAMIKPRAKETSQQKDPLWISAGKALSVGAVTGFVGAGGGFLIVPALVVMNSLPMKIAVGTSLGIIALNSFFGFFSDAIGGMSVDWSFVLKISALAVVGIVSGQQLGKRTSDTKLKPMFGVFVLIVGAAILLAQLLS
ncbi:sulfite exporter TauE/SafE family protein [Bdellovibrio sp. GT3]|uniref:sulfite exporter TauE/SafE family protein n=1 Tax=Bdellovibrio sp. GT3 TaxID=3136282 RepID=UPI0030F363C6